MRTMRAFTAITILLAAGIPSATAQDKAKGMGHNLPPLVKVTIAGFADGGEIPARYPAWYSRTRYRPPCSGAMCPPARPASR
jgi:hypothetical protein